MEDQCKPIRNTTESGLCTQAFLVRKSEAQGTQCSRKGFRIPVGAPKSDVWINYLSSRQEAGPEAEAAQGDDAVVARREHGHVEFWRFSCHVSGPGLVRYVSNRRLL